MNTLRQKIITGAVYGLAFLTLAGTANASGIFTDSKIKVSGETVETRQRVNADYGSWEIKSFMDKTRTDNTLEQTAGGWIAKNFNIAKDSTSSIDSKAYVRVTQSITDEKTNAVTGGIDLNIAKDDLNVYVLPVWTKITDGNVQNNFALTNVQNKAFEVGAAYEWNNGSHDHAGIFAIAKTGNAGFSVSEYVYDPIVSVAGAYSNGKAGVLVWDEHNYSNGDFKTTAFVAEHPSQVVGKDGLSTLGNVFCITQPAELDPYLTSTGRKSTDGIAGKLVVESKSDIWTITPEVGYNAGDLAIMIGSVFTGTPLKHDVVTGALHYSKGPVSVEVKGDTDNNYTVYTAFSKTF